MVELDGQCTGCSNPVVYLFVQQRRSAETRQKWINKALLLSVCVCAEANATRVIQQTNPNPETLS